MKRKNNDYNIDIPTKWDEITLQTFIKLKSLYNDGDQPSMEQLISILANKDIEDVKQYPAIVIERVFDKLGFLKDGITNEISNKVEIDNVTYQINYLEELKFGEYVDINTVLDSDNNNWAAILGILCRKENEIYNDDFIAKELPNRIKMFNVQPITRIYPLISFFLTLCMTSENNIQSYLETIRDQATRIVKHYITSLKNGDGRKRFLNWRMRKLQKLSKQLSNI